MFWQRVTLDGVEIGESFPALPSLPGWRMASPSSLMGRCWVVLEPVAWRISAFSVVLRCSVLPGESNRVCACCLHPVLLPQSLPGDPSWLPPSAAPRWESRPYRRSKTPLWGLTPQWWRERVGEKSSYPCKRPFWPWAAGRAPSFTSLRRFQVAFCRGSPPGKWAMALAVAKQGWFFPPLARWDWPVLSSAPRERDSRLSIRPSPGRL